MDGDALWLRDPDAAGAAQQTLESVCKGSADSALLGASVGALEIVLALDDIVSAVAVAQALLGAHAEGRLPQVAAAVHWGAVHAHRSMLTGRAEVGGAAAQIARGLAHVACEGQILLSEDAAQGAGDVSMYDGMRRIDLGDVAVAGQLIGCWQLAAGGLHTSLPSAPREAVDPSRSLGGLRFLGRRSERAEVIDALTAGHRCVTLTGPVGIGKSRVSEACAVTLVPNTLRDHLTVDLDGRTQPETIVSVIEATLGLREREALSLGARLTRIAAALAARVGLLLVIRDAEGLAFAPNIVDTLCRERRGATLLTSTLPIPGTTSVAIGPLDPLDALLLFKDRLVVAAPDAPTPPHSDIEDLVERLEFNPLAIEISATEAAAVGVAVTLAAARLDLDTRNSLFGAQNRPTTFRAAVRRQWNRLPKMLQRATMHLSVFRGPFRRIDAEAVCEGNPAHALQALEANALVRREGDLWQLHLPVLWYAREQLADSADASEAVERYVRHVARHRSSVEHVDEILAVYGLVPVGEERLSLSLALAAGPHLLAREDGATFLHLLDTLSTARIEDNDTRQRLIAAYRHLPDAMVAPTSVTRLQQQLPTATDPFVAVQLWMTLARVLGARREYSLAQSCLDKAADRASEEEALRGEFHLTQAHLCIQTEAWDRAQAELLAAYDLAAPPVPPGRLARIQLDLGRTLAGQGDLRHARIHFDAAALRSSQEGHTLASLDAHLHLAMLELARGEQGRAGTLLRSTTHLARVLNSARAEATALAWASAAALARGDRGEAARRLGVAQSCARVSPVETRKFVLVIMALAAAVRGDATEAWLHVAEARGLGGFLSPAMGSCMAEFAGTIAALTDGGPPDLDKWFDEGDEEGSWLEPRAARRILAQLHHFQ